MQTKSRNCPIVQIVSSQEGGYIKGTLLKELHISVSVNYLENIEIFLKTHSDNCNKVLKTPDSEQFHPFKPRLLTPNSFYVRIF